MSAKTLHRFRIAIGHTVHDRLSGNVEVDETVIGGVRLGKRGQGAVGKILVAVAVEQDGCFIVTTYPSVKFSGGRVCRGTPSKPG